jgi:hypothetical protein
MKCVAERSSFRPDSVTWQRLAVTDYIKIRDFGFAARRCLKTAEETSSIWTVYPKPPRSTEWVQMKVKFPFRTTELQREP